MAALLFRHAHAARTRLAAGLLCYSMPLEPECACLPAFPTPLPQLAEIYDQAKEGMFQGTYLPVSMYSCGEHTAGPLMRQRPTFLSATA